MTGLLPIPGPQAGSVTRDAALGALSSIPFVGSIAAQLLSGHMTTRRFERLEEFANILRVRVDVLRRDRDVNEAYARSDEYAEYVMRLGQKAWESHRPDRITLLAEVAAGAARSISSDATRDRFLSAVDALSPEHVKVLGVIADAPHAASSRDESVVDDDVTDIRRLLPDIEELDLEAIIAGLASQGLVEDVSTFSDKRGLWRATPLGRAFLESLVRPS